MTGKAIAPRFNERELQKIQLYIENRWKTSGKIINETEAVKEIVMEFFAMPASYRKQITKRQQWREHRNRGFRNLRNFIEAPPRPRKAGIAVNADVRRLPALQSETKKIN